MRLVRVVLDRIIASTWETRVAVTIPLLLALLALPVMLGAFASGASPGGASGGYGGPPTSKPAPGGPAPLQPAFALEVVPPEHLALTRA